MLKFFIFGIVIVVGLYFIMMAAEYFEFLPPGKSIRLTMKEVKDYYKIAPDNWLMYNDCLSYNPLECDISLSFFDYLKYRKFYKEVKRSNEHKNEITMKKQFYEQVRKPVVEIEEKYVAAPYFHLAVEADVSDLIKDCTEFKDIINYYPNIPMTYKGLKIRQIFKDTSNETYTVILQ